MILIKKMIHMNFFAFQHWADTISVNGSCIFLIILAIIFLSITLIFGRISYLSIYKTAGGNNKFRKFLENKDPLIQKLNNYVSHISSFFSTIFYILGILVSLWLLGDKVLFTLRDVEFSTQILLDYTKEQKEQYRQYKMDSLQNKTHIKRPKFLNQDFSQIELIIIADGGTLAILPVGKNGKAGGTLKIHKEAKILKIECNSKDQKFQPFTKIESITATKKINIPAIRLKLAVST